MSKATYRKYFYRVNMTAKNGTSGVFLADVRADCDDNARRMIIHAEFKAGNKVRAITPTEDLKPQEGEWYKRTYA